MTQAVQSRPAPESRPAVGDDPVYKEETSFLDSMNAPTKYSRCFAVQGQHEVSKQAASLLFEGMRDIQNALVNVTAEMGTCSASAAYMSGTTEGLGAFCQAGGSAYSAKGSVAELRELNTIRTTSDAKLTQIEGAKATGPNTFGTGIAGCNEQMRLHDGVRAQFFAQGQQPPAAAPAGTRATYEQEKATKADLLRQRADEKDRVKGELRRVQSDAQKTQAIGQMAGALGQMSAIGKGVCQGVQAKASANSTLADGAKKSADSVQSSVENTTRMANEASVVEGDRAVSSR